jgi:hypothetical protein
MTFEFDKDDYYIIKGDKYAIFKYEVEVFANGKRATRNADSMREAHRKAKRTRKILYIEEQRFSFE